MSETIDAQEDEDEQDPLINALLSACMSHGLTGDGMFNYVKVSVAMIAILADVIGRQQPKVRNAMVKDFAAALNDEVIRRSQTRIKIISSNVRN